MAGFDFYRFKPIVLGWIVEKLKRMGTDIRTTEGLSVGNVHVKPEAGNGYFTGDLSVGGKAQIADTLTVSVPTADEHAATKKYVDDIKAVYGTPYWSNSGWDGDDTKTTANSPYAIDTSSVFSIPAGVKMVLASVTAEWATAASASYLGIRTTAGALLYVLRAHTTYPQNGCFLIPCDSNGDFRITVHNASALNVSVYILAYWM